MPGASSARTGLKPRKAASRKKRTADRYATISYQNWLEEALAKREITAMPDVAARVVAFGLEPLGSAERPSYTAEDVVRYLRG